MRAPSVGIARPQRSGAPRGARHESIRSRARGNSSTSVRNGRLFLMQRIASSRLDARPPLSACAPLRPAAGAARESRSRQIAGARAASGDRGRVRSRRDRQSPAARDRPAARRADARERGGRPRVEPVPGGPADGAREPARTRSGRRQRHRHVLPRRAGGAERDRDRTLRRPARHRRDEAVLQPPPAQRVERVRRGSRVDGPRRDHPRVDGSRRRGAAPRSLEPVVLPERARDGPAIRERGTSRAAPTVRA